MEAISAMDAISERVESFVAEILGLAGQARDESRADALALVSRMLGAPAPAGGPAPGSPVKRGRGRPRKVTAPLVAPAPAAEPAAVAPRKRGRPRKVVAPVQAQPTEVAPRPVAQRRAAQRRAAPAEPPPAPATIPSAPAPSAEAPSSREATDREALVLSAVRALMRATAGEVAERCGQPNGSVYVALRSLVAQGLVARAKTARGIEYSLPG